MIYTFRFISNEEESFVLDININHDQTFEDLHLAIQNTLNYDPSQMASFFTSNNDWEKLEEIAGMDMGLDIPVKSMSNTKIENCFNEKNQRILYIFDFLSERLFFGSVTRLIDADPPIKLPSVSRLEGKIPNQISMSDEFSNNDLLGIINSADSNDIDEETDYLEDIDSFDDTDY